MSTLHLYLNRRSQGASARSQGATTTLEPSEPFAAIPHRIWSPPPSHLEVDALDLVQYCESTRRLTCAETRSTWAKTKREFVETSAHKPTSPQLLLRLLLVDCCLDSRKPPRQTGTSQSFPVQYIGPRCRDCGTCHPRTPNQLLESQCRTNPLHGKELPEARAGADDRAECEAERPCG